MTNMETGKISSVTDVVKDSKTDDKLKKKAPAHRFKKGNTMGVRFGEGQPINMAGRPKGGPSIVKQAMQNYESNALIASQYLVEKAMDPEMDPKIQFSWFKELNSRILGAAKGSAEDIVNQLAEKLEGTVSLSRPALEAAAMKDVKALIKELYNEGVLDKVIEEVKNEQ